MWTWATKLTESLYTKKTKATCMKWHRNSPKSMIWMMKVRRSYCSCLKWSWKMCWRKLTKIRKEMDRNIIMNETDINKLLRLLIDWYDVNNFFTFLLIQCKKYPTILEIVKCSVSYCFCDLMLEKDLIFNSKRANYRAL